MTEKRAEEEADCKLIECTKCLKVLNGLSLYILADANATILCEACYAALPDEHQ